LSPHQALTADKPKSAEMRRVRQIEDIRTNNEFLQKHLFYIQAWFAAAACGVVAPSTLSEFVGRGEHVEILIWMHGIVANDHLFA
jgi:hypothetical protein